MLGTVSLIKYAAQSFESFKFSDDCNKYAYLIIGILPNNSVDTSFRSFLVNILDMKKVLQRIEKIYPDNYLLVAKIYIPSEVSSTNDEKYVVLYGKKRHYSKSFLYPNTTTFIEMKVNRIVDEKYVSIT